VNHASFLFEIADIRLLSDPWIEGPAFYNGWDLISESVFRYEDFRDVTHIWFSHQHPDHFNPQNLKNIPPEIRSNITVLFQQTRDHLVTNFCRGLKFKEVIELHPGRWSSVSQDLQVRCGPIGDIDSWIALRTSWGTVLNINDCVVDTKAVCRRIQRRVGPVRLLATQFSYANWCGNPENPEARITAARKTLQQVLLQCSMFDPEFVILFASFIFYSHEENFYHNDHMNRVGAVAHLIEEAHRRKAIVLYPGEEWSLGSPHDWRPAASRYEEDFNRRIASGPVRATRPMASETLLACADTYFQRLHNHMPAWMPKPWLKTTVAVKDHARSYELSFDGIKELAAGPSLHADIETSAENLYYAFKTPWGAEALGVNGRFRECASGGSERFARFFHAANLYSEAKFDAAWLSAQLVRRGLRVLAWRGRVGVSTVLNRLRGDPAQRS